MNRPQTIVVLSMTADGKITDRLYSPARFGSQVDKLHLEKQISLVDGVIFGAGTLRSYGTTLLITNLELLQARQKRSQPSQPVHIVCSASGKLDPNLRFFRQPVPRWLLTTSTGAKLWQGKNEFERILILINSQNDQSTEIKSLKWLETLAELKQLGIDKLAILGGGQLVASLLAVDAVDELYLTVCPLILGGQNTPTPVEGQGWLQEQGLKLELIKVNQIEHEVFLHYTVIKERGKATSKLSSPENSHKKRD